MIDANFRTFIQSSDFAKFQTVVYSFFFFRVLQITRVTLHNTNQTGSFPLHHPDGVEFCSHYILSLLPRRCRWLLLALAGYPDENNNNPKKKVRRRVEDDGKREKAVPLTNSQTGKTVNTRNISGMLLCCKEKANQMRKLNCNQERKLVCGFVASLRVLIFALIGHNTINIPEIFQVFTVLTA